MTLRGQFADLDRPHVHFAGSGGNEGAGVSIPFMAES